MIWMAVRVVVVLALLGASLIAMAKCFKGTEVGIFETFSHPTFVTEVRINAPNVVEVHGPDGYLLDGWHAEGAYGTQRREFPRRCYPAGTRWSRTEPRAVWMSAKACPK